MGVRLHESPFTPERVLAALRAKKNAKPINLTEGVDPTDPSGFREHGGSLWFKGKGPERHALDPSRRAQPRRSGRRRLSLPQFKLLRPRTLDDALNLLAKHAGEGARATRVVAGGTDLIPSMRQKLFDPEYVLDIRNVAGLKDIRQTDHGVEIGALASLTAIEQSALLRRRYPVLTEAAATVASPLLRNMGTIGGNICLDTRCLWYNQSLTWRKGCGFCIKKDGDLCHVAPGGTKCWAAFSGDTPPALLCLAGGNRDRQRIGNPAHATV